MINSGRAITSFSFTFPKLLLALLILLLGGGCWSGKNLSPDKTAQICLELPGPSDGGRVSLFLNLEQPLIDKIHLEIAEIEVLSGAEWLSVLAAPKALSTGVNGRSQFFLGSRVVPKGSYRAVRVTVANVQIGDGENKTGLEIRQPVAEFILDSPFEIAAGTNRLLFMSWDAQASIVNGIFQSPALQISDDRGLIIVSELIFVAAPEIDTVYMVCPDSNRVCGSIAIPGKPTSIYTDNSSKKMIALTPGDNSIRVVDLVSRRIVDTFTIPFVDDPVFMTIDPEARTAFVIDRRGIMVSVDLITGEMIARNRIGTRPGYAVYLPRQDKLAVSSDLDQKIYFVDPGNLQISGSVLVDGSPQALLAWEDFLYIIDHQTGALLVYDLNARVLLNRISVGFSPARMLADHNSIYVTDSLDGSVSLINGGQLNVSKEIAVGESPNEMAVAEHRRFLYVGQGDCGGSLAVIDLSSNRVAGEIELGARPAGMAVIQ